MPEDENDSTSSELDTAETSSILSATVPALTELVLKLKIEVDAAFSTYLQNPSVDEVIDMINTIIQNNPNEDINHTQTVLYFIVQDKISSLPNTTESAKIYHETLHTALIKSIPSNQSSSKSLLKKMMTYHESFKETTKPLYLGNESEAKHNVNEREEWVADRVNEWVSSADEATFGDLNKYLEFNQTIIEKHKLSTEDIIAFKATLKNPDATPLMFEQDSTVTKSTRWLKRSAKSVIGGLITDKPLDELPTIAKEQRKQIELIFALVQDETKITKESLKVTQQEILQSHKAQLNRESKQGTSIVARVAKGEITGVDGIKQIGGAIQHSLHKAHSKSGLIGVGQKVAGVGIKGIAGLTKFAVKSTAGLAKKAVVKPIETVAKGGLAAVNAMECLTLSLQAGLENDTDKKEKLQQAAQEKLSNLGYNSRKSFEALLVSVATALIIATTVQSGGVSLVAIEAAQAIQALTAVHTLQAVDIIDNINSGVEFFNFLLQIVNESSRGTKYLERHELMELIQQTIAEINLEEENNLELEVDNVTLASQDTESLTSEDNDNQLDTKPENLGDKTTLFRELLKQQLQNHIKLQHENITDEETTDNTNDSSFSNKS